MRKPDASALSVKFKSRFVGNHERTGIFPAAARYLVLTAIGFIFLYPIIYMIANSFQSPADLSDPSVIWIPTGLYWENFRRAFEALDFGNGLRNALLVAVVSAVFQTAATSFIGYGLARFPIPLKKLWIVLVILTFFIPVEITSVPRYVLFFRYGFVDTLLPSYLPAVFGQGLNAAVFILVFVMFFQSYPLAFDEAAALDGAGRFRIYIKIALPMSKPAIILSLLFSSVWYWNETSQSQMYFGNTFPTLMHKLSEFASRYASMMNETAGASTTPTQAITLAGTMLAILPMLLFYLVCQRHFINSIDQSGITGE